MNVPAKNDRLATITFVDRSFLSSGLKGFNMPYMILLNILLKPFNYSQFIYYKRVLI